MNQLMLDAPRKPFKEVSWRGLSQTTDTCLLSVFSSTPTGTSLRDVSYTAVKDSLRRVWPWPICDPHPYDSRLMPSPNQSSQHVTKTTHWASLRCACGIAACGQFFDRNIRHKYVVLCGESWHWMAAGWRPSSSTRMIPFCWELRLYLFVFQSSMERFLHMV